ncbi:MAG: hypothetical protein PGN15_06660 [Aeromicrobium erythreum]
MSASQHDPDRNDPDHRSSVERSDDRDERRPDEKPFGDDAQERQGDDAASGGS